MSDPRPLAKFGAIVTLRQGRHARGVAADRVIFSLTIEGGSDGSPTTVSNALLGALVSPWSGWPVSQTKTQARVQVALAGGDQVMRRSTMVSALRKTLIEAHARPRTLSLLLFEIGREALVTASSPFVSSDGVEAEIALRRRLDRLVKPRVTPIVERDFAAGSLRFPQVIEEFYGTLDPFDQVLIEWVSRAHFGRVALEFFPPFLRPGRVIDEPLLRATVERLAVTGWLTPPEVRTNGGGLQRIVGLGPKAKKLGAVELLDFHTR